jgi:hypothetical protein
MNKTEASWQRSSFCGGGGNNCVEVAAKGLGVILRESEDPSETLLVNREVFGWLMAAVKTGRLANLGG